MICCPMLEAIKGLIRIGTVPLIAIPALFGNVADVIVNGLVTIGEYGSISLDLIVARPDGTRTGIGNDIPAQIVMHVQRGKMVAAKAPLDSVIKAEEY